MVKICCRCLIEKDICLFGKDKNSSDNFTHACRDCRNKAGKEYRKNNPHKQKERNIKNSSKRKEFYNSAKGIESSRRAHLKRMFNITLEDYNILSENQNHVCAICKGKETSYRNKVLSVDHNHNTGEIRGLLCNTCNRALGLFKDNLEIINNAIKYLKNEFNLIN